MPIGLASPTDGKCNCAEARGVLVPLLRPLRLGFVKPRMDDAPVGTGLPTAGTDGLGGATTERIGLGSAVSFLISLRPVEALPLGPPNGVIGFGI